MKGPKRPVVPPFVKLPPKDPMSLTRREAAERVKTMASFIEHPGWEIYEAQLKQVEAFCLEQMVSTEDPNHRQLLVGQIRMLRKMYGWPVAHAKACQDAEIREQETSGQGGFAPEV